MDPRRTYLWDDNAELLGQPQVLVTERYERMAVLLARPLVPKPDTRPQYTIHPKPYTLHPKPYPEP